MHLMSVVLATLIYGILNGSEVFVSILPFQFPIGMGAAASVRVSNALGAGNSEQAKLSCKVSIICTCKGLYYLWITVVNRNWQL